MKARFGRGSRTHIAARLGWPLLVAIAGAVAAGGPVRAQQMDPAKPAPPPVITPDEERRFAEAWAQQPVVDLGVPAGTAKVVVVKFNDWLCSGCKAMQSIYQPVFDKFAKEAPGAVKFVVKDWPWNSRCNAAVSNTLPGHQASCEAAVAVRLARDKGKEDAMVSWLFDNQDLLNRLGMEGPGAAESIRARATVLLGIKAADFDAEYEARQAAIKQDVLQGSAINVEVTPTYFVNGIRTTAPVDPNGPGGGYNLPVGYFELGIRLELKKKAPGH